MTDILELLGLRVSRQDIRDALTALGPPGNRAEATVHAVCQAVAAAPERSAGAAPLWEPMHNARDCPECDHRLALAEASTGAAPIDVETLKKAVSTALNDALGPPSDGMSAALRRAGWAGIGAMLIVCGVAELALFAVPVWWARVQRSRRERAVLASGPPYLEEIVGELFADPAFIAELDQAEADIAAGLGTPYREIRRERS